MWSFCWGEGASCPPASAAADRGNSGIDNGNSGGGNNIAMVRDHRLCLEQYWEQHKKDPRHGAACSATALLLQDNNNCHHRNDVTGTTPFLVLIALLVMALTVQFAIVFG
jgi:hypothetical protein